jgi:hypothetical protein
MLKLLHHRKNKSVPVFPVLMFFILLFVPASSAEFRNGSCLINSDNTEYTFTYEDYPLTTRICSCVKPTPTMKNGLAPAYYRNSIKGFKIINKKEINMTREIITAVIQPNTTVRCLTVLGTKITLNNSASIEVQDGKTAVIQNGKLHIQ